MGKLSASLSRSTRRRAMMSESTSPSSAATRQCSTLPRCSALHNEPESGLIKKFQTFVEELTRDRLESVLDERRQRRWRACSPLVFPVKPEVCGREPVTLAPHNPLIHDASLASTFSASKFSSRMSLTRINLCDGENLLSGI
jgi:hypothetical protein